MKFDEKYPSAIDGDRPEPFLVRTFMYSCCHVCTLERRVHRTGWRRRAFDTPGLPVCSDDCLAKMNADDPPPNQDPEYATSYPLARPSLFTWAELQKMTKKDDMVRAILDDRVADVERFNNLVSPDSPPGYSVTVKEPQSQ